MFGRSVWQLVLLFILCVTPLACFVAVGIMTRESWVYGHQEEAPTYVAVGILTFFASLGWLFFILRENARIFYGLIEVLASVGFYYVSIISTVNLYDAAGPRPIAAWVLYVAPYAGALYIFVRGLDNIGTGLRRYPRIDRIWQWISMRPVAPKPAKPLYPWTFRKN